MGMVGKKKHGKAISGVYTNDSGEIRVLSRKQFLRKLHHRGGGTGTSKVMHWRQYHMPRPE